MRWLRATLAAHVGGFPSTFWWLWSGALVNALATFIFPFLPLFLTSRGFSPSSAGLVTAVFGAGTVVAAPLGGTLADRIGRRATLLLSLTSGAAAAAALGFVGNPAILITVVFVFGLGASMARPALAATVADVAPGADRARAFGLLYWAHNLGTGFSMAVGGFVAARSWIALFLADAGTMLAFAALVWRRIPETRPCHESHSPPTGERVGERGSSSPGSAGYGALLADRPFLLWLALHVAFAVVFTQFLAAGTIDMARHGLPPSEIGLVLSVNGVLIVSIQPWATSRLARFPAGQVLAWASALVGVGYGGYAFCSAGWQYALATAVWTMGEIAYLPIAAALVAELSPAHLRGRYQGAYSLSWGLASCLAPVLGPTTLQAFGPRALWVGCLLAALAVALGQHALGRARSRGADRAGRTSAGRPGASSTRGHA